jgi:hypothetical protein
LFKVNKVGKPVLGEAQERDGTARCRVAAEPERHDLDGGVARLGIFCDVDKVLNLRAHGGCAAHRAAQRSLVDDGPEARRAELVLTQEPLALHPQAHPPAHLLTRCRLMTEADHGAGVA